MNTTTSHEYNGMMGISPPDQGLDLEFLDIQAEAALQAKNEKLASLFVNPEQIRSSENVDQYYIEKLKELNLHPADLALYLFEPQNFVQIMDSSRQAILPSFFYDIWAKNHDRFDELYNTVDPEKQDVVLDKIKLQLTGYVNVFLDNIRKTDKDENPEETGDSQKILSGIPEFFTDILKELSEDDEAKPLLDQLKESDDVKALLALRRLVIEKLNEKLSGDSPDADDEEDSKASNAPVEALKSVEEQVDELSEAFFTNFAAFIAAEGFVRNNDQFKALLLRFVKGQDLRLEQAIASLVSDKDLLNRISEVVNPVIMDQGIKNSSRRTFEIALKGQLRMLVTSDSTDSTSFVESPVTTSVQEPESQTIMRRPTPDEDKRPEISARDRIAQNLNKLLGISWGPVLGSGETVSSILSRRFDSAGLLSFNTNVFPYASRVAAEITNTSSLDELSSSYEKKMSDINSIVQANSEAISSLKKIVELGSLIAEDYRVIDNAPADQQVYASLFDEFKNKFTVGPEPWRIKTVLGNVVQVVAEAKKYINEFSDLEQRTRNEISEKVASQERTLIMQSESFRDSYSALLSLNFDKIAPSGVSEEVTNTVDELLNSSNFINILMDYRTKLLDSPDGSQTMRLKDQLLLTVRDTLLKNWPKRIPAAAS